MRIEWLLFSGMFAIGILGLWRTGGYRKLAVWCYFSAFFALSFIVGRFVGTDWLLHFVPPGTAYIVAIDLFHGLLCWAVLVAFNTLLARDSGLNVAARFLEMCLLYLCMVPFMHWFGYYGFRLLIRDL